MRRSALSLLFFSMLLLTGPAVAQPIELASLAGAVTDAETGEPLEGVHVFIAESMNGTTTDAEGRYRLINVPVGAHRLYVSAIGFEPEARDILLREGRTFTFNFELAPRVVEIDGVTVEAERDRRWERRLKEFTRLFIGESPNAELTTIVNPEVLDFANERGEFQAYASEPLVIENRALGYRVQYFLKEFAATTTRTRYDGEPLFEELEPKDAAEAAMWEANRREAFMGSFRHFLLALMAGQTEPQGFLVYSRPSASDLGSNTAFGQVGAMGGNRFPLDPTTIFKPGEAPTEHVLDFDGFVEIVYTGETEDPSYLDWAKRRGKPKYQTSQISLERGPAVFDYKGDVLDPYGVTFYSYLAFERVADEVPKEYRPAS